MSKTYDCIIVDDEPLAIDVIKKYVERTPQLNLIATCTDAIQAYQLINDRSIDLIFLDIEMPELTGFDLARSLPNHSNVIFTTAHREYAVESYELEVVDYLLKPISFQRYFKSITKFLNQKQPSEQNIVEKEVVKMGRDAIYVYADKKNHKVYLDEILYIESLKDYVRIYMEEGNLVTKSTISHYEDKLPSDFLRVHRSFIINRSKITAYTNQDIEIGKKEIPIGVSYKKSVVEQLKA